MKKYQIVRFCAHLYLKTGLETVLGPNVWPYIGPILVQIVVNDITVYRTFNYSQPNHHIVGSVNGGVEFGSENVKYGHFGPIGPPKMAPGPLVGMMKIAKWLSLIKGGYVMV